MKKKLLLLVSVLVAALSINAQVKEESAGKLMAYKTKADSVEGWKFFGVAGVTFGQTSLTNWSAGGDNTVSLNGIFNVSANYKKGLWFWDNNLAAEYGMVYSTANDWQKSTDRLNLMSVGGRRISKYWSASFLLNFSTQFAKGYDYSEDPDLYKSTFMAPGYLDGALGFTYKPNDKYTVFLSPIAERATFVLDDYFSNLGAYGVDPGKKSVWRTGAYLMATTKQTLLPNLDVISTLDLFTPYNDNFGNVDMNWNILLNYKLGKWLTASLNTTLRYYESEITKIQFKEIFGLGLTYSF